MLLMQPESQLLTNAATSKAMMSQLRLRSNSGRISIFVIFESHSQMQLMQLESRLYHGHANIKNHDVAAQTSVANFF
jgi:hypothetical protein